MKINAFNVGTILLISCFLWVGCGDDDSSGSTGEESSQTDDLVTTQAVTQSEQQDVENAVNEINATVGSNFDVETGTSKNPNLEEEQKISRCVAISLEEDEDSNVILIFDYGEEGCELSNGDVISGRIVVTYNTASDEELQIDYVIEDFSYNDINVTGSANAVYDFENEDGNYVYTSNSEFNFEWPDGLTATDVATYSTETIDDEDEETFFSFYTLLTGNGETNYSNGDSYTFEITNPLRSEPRCRYFVSGTLVTTENNETTTLDYGDGECDNLATLTDNEGTETEIDLDEERKDDEETES